MNTLVIARNTFQDSLRKRVVLVFVALALVMMGLAILLRFLTIPDRSALFAETQLLIILVFGGLIAITTSVFLLPGEIERRTIYAVLSKPVRRWEFFLGKFLGGLLTTGSLTALMAVALLLALFGFSLFPSPAPALDPGQQAAAGGAERFLWPVVRGCAAIFFQLSIVTAIATTLSLFLTATVNFSVSTFVWILGSLQWLLSSLSSRNEQGFFIIPWILKAFYYLTPHFHDINVMGDVVKPEVAIQMNPYAFAANVTLYGLVYAAVVLFVGILAFERREV